MDTTKEYNGFKAYWADGSQIKEDIAGRIAAEMDRTDIFTGVRTMDLEKAAS